MNKMNIKQQFMDFDIKFKISKIWTNEKKFIAFCNNVIFLTRFIGFIWMAHNHLYNTKDLFFNFCILHWLSLQFWTLFKIVFLTIFTSLKSFLLIILNFDKKLTSYLFWTLFEISFYANPLGLWKNSRA